MAAVGPEKAIVYTMLPLAVKTSVDALTGAVWDGVGDGVAERCKGEAEEGHACGGGTA